jgi:hypothetical protein
MSDVSRSQAPDVSQMSARCQPDVRWQRFFPATDNRQPTTEAYWHASQLSGFSSEQAKASASLNRGFAASAIVAAVLAIPVAGRERR